MFWAESNYPLPRATLFSNFSTAKRLHSKERKQKPFAAQTPPRKRGYFSTHQTIVGKNFPYLRNFLSSLADAPRCSIMGFVQTQTISEKVLLFIYSNSQQDSFFRPARYREMTLLNVTFMFGLFLLIWCENGLSTSTCSFLHRLFGIEKVAKDFRGSNAAAKAWLRGGFRLPQLTTPPKFQKLSFRTVPETMPRNRRATSARMGLVST